MLAWMPSASSPAAGSAGPATVQAVSTPALVPKPGYYRPVVVNGKTFPLARSNYLNLLEFSNNWHAPRLRFEGGRWLLVGVHEGIDIAAEWGTPIVSMTAGTVENVGWTFYSGTRVGIRGPDGRYYFYAHLSWVAPGIVAGARVAPGRLLGHVGNTGYGPDGTRDRFPPHLHFGIESSSGWVSPWGLLVSLYDVMVRAQDRGRAELDRLALQGDLAGWNRLASRLFEAF